VIAVVIPLGIDGLVTHLSAGGLFLMSAAITALGLLVLVPRRARRPEASPKTRVVTGVLGALFVLGTTISVLALHGFAAIGLASASLIPVVLAYVLLRRDPR
jgi:hypothetical protein